MDNMHHKYIEIYICVVAIYKYIYINIYELECVSLIWSYKYTNKYIITQKLLDK